MDKELRPNKSELAFLTLSYNRFYDIFEEAINDSFWEKEEWYRFSKVKDGFAVDIVPIVVGGLNGHSSSHSLRHL
jgi:hypothetical protein